MGASSSTHSNKFEYNEPLVRNDSVSEPDLSKIYGAILEQKNDSRYIGNSSLLDPSGHLSQELQEVLEEEFMKYSNGLLVIARNELKSFIIACYPALNSSIESELNRNGINYMNSSGDKDNTGDNNDEHDYYTDRVNYILSRYGKPFKDVRSHFAKILCVPLPEQVERPAAAVVEETNDSIVAGKRNTVTMVDHHGPNYKNKKGNNSTTQSGIMEDSKENNSNNYTQNENRLQLTKSKNNNNSIANAHSVSIQEDQNVIERTIHCNSIDDSEIVLPKTKFLLFYRKSCFDREMMVRLELTELGYAQFRGMLVDRSKSIDLLAYKVQQLRNQEQTHLEEKERIANATSAEECADLITDYIETNIDPLDASNDNDNLYRKRRPIKFGRCCYSICPCIVCLARCCC